MSSQITARVESDKSKVTLVIEAGFDPGQLTPILLRSVAAEVGVEITPAVEQAIAACMASYTPGDDPVEAQIASWTEPEHGVDGWIEWAEGFDPTDSDVDSHSDTDADAAADGDGSETTDTGSTDHYAGTHYVSVRPDDVLGCLHEPTPGADGLDVLGNCLKAIPGKPSPIKLHSSVRLESDGRIVSVLEGVISLKGNTLEIVQQLPIADCVDFSTGHIDFAGSVIIKNAIRTGFNVHAEQDIQVGGLIEASEIVCGGDLTAKQGMAGKGRGTVQVGGDVDATYLEDVSGLIAGDLKFRNSLIGCDLKVGGDVDGSSGVIRGGTLYVGGVFQVKSLGSSSSPVTEVHLGRDPKLQELLERTQAMVETTNAALTGKQAQYDQLSAFKNPSDADRARMGELLAEIQGTQGVLARAQGAIEQTHKRIHEAGTLDVQVSGQIFPAVTLVVGEQRLTFKSAITGPISVFWNDERQVVYKIGSTGETRAIELITDISPYEPAAAA